MPTFVTPLMLAGIGLVTVPILLHLLMQQQPKHLIFPALRFIQQRSDVNRRRLKLRHLILLLLRIAAIALVAAALARPVFQSAGLLAGGDAPVAAALVFDTGVRMEYQHRNQTRLDEAKKLGRTLLSQLPAESEVAVFDGQAARADFEIESSMAGLKIDRLAVSPVAQSLLAEFDQALAVVRKSTRPRKEIHLFTDLSQAQWGGDQTAAWGKRLKENTDVAVYAIDVGVPDPQNFGLGGIELSNQVISQSGTLGVRTELFREGPAGQRTVRLFFTNPGRPPELKGEGTYACQKDASTQLEFRLGALPLGTHQGYLEIVDDDALKSDNRRYFTVRIAPPWRVLVVAPPPVATKALLITQLLTPTRQQREGRAEFECSAVDYAALADAKIGSFDTIWLLDPPPMAEAVWKRLAQYVNDGHNLAVVLGAGAGPTGEALNTGPPQSVLPGKLSLLVNAAGDDLLMAPDRLEHPVFQMLRQMQGAIPWDKNPIFKYWDIGPLDESAQILLRYGNGKPALIEQRLGRGRVLTLTTSLTESSRRPWNLLLMSQREAWPGFALVWGMAQYLVGKTEERTNYRVGEVAVLQMGREELFDSYLLTTPLSDSIKVHEQEGTIHFGDTKIPGQYELRAGGETDVRRGLSVNVDPAATRLARADEKALLKNFDKLSFRLARNTDDLARQRRAGEAVTRWEAYPWLLLLAVLAVVGENVLSSLFYRRQVRAPVHGSNG